MKQEKKFSELTMKNIFGPALELFFLDYGCLQALRPLAISIRTYDLVTGFQAFFLFFWLTFHVIRA